MHLFSFFGVFEFLAIGKQIKNLFLSLFCHISIICKNIWTVCLDLMLSAITIFKPYADFQSFSAYNLVPLSSEVLIHFSQSSAQWESK